MRIKIYVQPRASRTELAGRHGTEVKVRLTSPPVDNAANEELVAFVAQQLGISKRQVRVVAGARSRRKTLELVDAPAETVALLCGAAQSL